MKLYNNNFIGRDYASVVQSWSGSDNIERLDNNLEKMPNDWYYRTNEITYDYNSLGHRSKEIDKLDLDNYILFTGCSLTEGLGLELSKTYSNLVSQQLNSDYYNLGLGSTGIDTMLHNLIIWREVVPKLPKILVVQWPERVRYLTSTPNLDMILSKGPWNNESEVERFILAGEESNFFLTRRLLAYKIIETLFKCKIIQINIYSNSYDKGVLTLRSLDLARDNMHPGIESNLKFANRICREILGNRG